jgi:hypothetical protein
MESIALATVGVKRKIPTLERKCRMIGVHCAQIGVLEKEDKI